MRPKTSQMATEMVVILAGVLIVLLIIVVVNTNIIGSVNTRFRYTKAKVAVNDIGDAAELVYQQGTGSKTKVYISLPNSINTATVSGKTIAINFKGEEDVVYRNLGFDVTGNLPIDESFYWICVESMEGYVLVNECEINVSLPVCGNDVKEAGEDCDGSDLSPYSSDCSTYPGFDGGTLSCYSDCSGYNTSLCTITPPPPPISLNIGTQTCFAEDNAVKGNFGGSCDGTYPESCGASADLLTCNDGKNETHTAYKSGLNSYYGGIKISSYNSSVTDCNSVTNVKLCYEWWRDGELQDCDVSVDADGGITFTAVTNDCPGSSANPGVICTNVTSLETWTCSNFFGASGTRAYAKSEAQRSGGVGTTTIAWDVLYFNVTYTTG